MNFEEKIILSGNNVLLVFDQIVKNDLFLLTNEFIDIVSSKRCKAQVRIYKLS